MSHTPIDTSSLCLSDFSQRDDCIVTHYQPLVSIKAGAVIGLEALSRGYLPSKDVILPPSVLFGLPENDKERLALDRKCRQLAMNRFSAQHQMNRETLLTVNLDMSLINSEILGSGKFLEATKQARIDPRNIVIEIIESSVKDADILIRFIETYRELGFLIALDDIGTGHSNLDRIAQIKPDIIKIDKGLIRDIDSEYYKFEIAKALVRLSRNIGAMVVGEGVETEQEVLRLMELGVDIFQGFFFARPMQLNGSIPAPPLKAMDRVASLFRSRAIEAINTKKELHAAYDRALMNMVTALSDASPRDFDTVLATQVDEHPDIECLYVLNNAGRQVSHTMCNPACVSESKRFIYYPAPKGADHSLKEYYLAIEAGLKKYTTEEYLSLASGNLCATIALRFYDNSGRTFILCVDVGVAP